MDATVEGLGHLGIDGRAESHQAAECRLHVAARTAEAVIKVEMAESGIEVVAPHQPDHAAAEPDAFRIAGRAVDGLGRLDELVGLALAFLGGVCRGRLRGLVLGPEIAALRDGGTNSDEKGQSGYGDVLERSNSKS